VTSDPFASVTRFAPSPNGLLHIGHAFSAIVAHDFAKQADGGRFLLRIEDIDGPRSDAKLADIFRRDLEWLGLEWIEVGRGRCCDGIEQASGSAAWRLDVDLALATVGEIFWTDERAGSVIADPREFGDVVLVRKDLPASYHLAVTLDDAADGVTIVTRGQDLFEVTPIHRVLQELLNLPVPHWLHHKLLLDETGQKLAKRRGSASLMERRLNGEDGLMLAEQLRLHKIEGGT